MNPSDLATAAMARVRASQERERADLLLAGGQVINVWSGETYRADVAVKGDTIVAVRDTFGGEAAERVDCRGLFLAPMPLTHLPADKAIMPPVVSSSFDDTVAALRNSCAVGLDGDAAAIGRQALRLREAGFPLANVYVPPRPDADIDAALPPALAAAGLSPAQIWCLLAFNAARLFGREIAAGSLAPGRRADILLLSQPGVLPPALVVACGILRHEPVTSSLSRIFP